MKQVLLLLTFFFFAGVSIHLLHIRMEPVDEAVDLLPFDTVFLVEWKNKEMQQNLATLLAPEHLGQIFAHPAVEYALGELDMVKGQAGLSSIPSSFLHQLAQISSLQGIPEGRIRLALLPDHSVEDQEIPPFSLARMVVFFPVVISEAAEQEKFARLFGPVLSSEEKWYNQHGIRSFVLASGKTIVLCQYNNILICGFSGQVVRYCLDQPFQKMTRSTESLRQNVHYRMLQSYGEDADFSLWLRPDLLRLLLAGDPDIPQGKEEKFLAAIACFYTADKGGAEHLRLVARSLPGQWHALSRQYGADYSAGRAFFKQSESGTLLHVWLNGLSPELLRNLEKWWHGGARDAAGEKDVRPPLQMRETGLAASFFTLLGSQAELRIDEEPGKDRSSGFIVCAQMQVRDSKRVVLLLDTIFADIAREKRLAGRTVMTSVLLANGLLRPSYALFQGHLVAADTPEMLVRTLSRLEEEETFPEKEQGSHVSLLEDSDRIECFFLFLRMRELSQRLLPILHLLSIKPQGGKNILSDENRRQLRHLVIPFLTSARNIEMIGLRGALLGDDILLDLALKRLEK